MSGEEDQQDLGTMQEAFSPGSPLATTPPPALIEAEKEAEKQRDQLKSLSEHPGWKIIEDHLTETVKKYENVHLLLADDKRDAQDVLVEAKANTRTARELRSVLEEVQGHAAKPTQE